MQVRSQVHTRSFRRLSLPLAVLLLPTAAACSSFASVDEASPDRITLVNRMSAPIVYYAMTPEVASRSLIGVSGPVGKPPLRPGLASTLTADSIEGEYRSGSAVVFYLYEVAGDSMVRRDLFALTGADLERIGYRLEVTQLPLRPTRTPPSR